MKKPKRRPGWIAVSLLLLTALFNRMIRTRPAEASESMLYPAGPAASRIADLWWEMLVVYGSIYIIALGLLAAALVIHRKNGRLPGPRFVFIAGIAIPTVVLVVMLALTVHDTIILGKGSPGLQVNVTSHHWWFEVHYPQYNIVDANEIHIPVGVLTTFELVSDAVVHSFWVPRLGGKRDMLPDHPTSIKLQADEAGNYRGTCTEYCAGPHALMAFRLIAHDPEDFERWVDDRRRPPAAPADPRLVRGERAFIQEGCMACHAIRGLSESSTGPDLTHVGSRKTLGAGTIVNTPGSLAGWIANPQDIKPENLMPKSYLPPEDLHALTAYLWSLK
ncbi:MAG: c-type cytochrome [Desulfobacterales bacterium]